MYKMWGNIVQHHQHTRESVRSSGVLLALVIHTVFAAHQNTYGPGKLIVKNTKSSITSEEGY